MFKKYVSLQKTALSRLKCLLLALLEGKMWGFVFHCHENVKVISIDTITHEVSKTGFQAELISS